MYKDHKGNEFNSIREMAEYYGQHGSTVHGRMARGWTIEEALTVDTTTTHACKIKPKKDYIRDHKGQLFISVAAMCEYWGVDRAVYYGRKKLGWSLEDILTRPLDYTGGAECVFDHYGNEYMSEQEMCKHYGIKRSTYRERKKRGWDTEKALTYATANVIVPEKRIGEFRYANCGLKMTVIACEGVDTSGNKNKKYNTYCVEFEDGTRVHHVKYSKFAIGRVGHPTLNISHTAGHLGVVNTWYIGGLSQQNILYKCQCTKCNIKDIWTPQMILQHQKQHNE